MPADMARCVRRRWLGSLFDAVAGHHVVPDEFSVSRCHLWLLPLLGSTEQHLYVPPEVVQAFVGDQHGLNTRKYQPAKIAAIEGLWETEKGGTALNLFGIPDMQAETTRYAVSIPHLGSLILREFDRHGADVLVLG